MTFETIIWLYHKLLEFSSSTWITVIITLILSTYLISVAADKLWEELELAWKKLKLPWSVRWATFDAMASSVPELVTSIIWILIFKSFDGVALWTVAGSWIFNIIIIPILAILAYKGKDVIKIHNWSVNRDALFYFLSIMIFVIWFALNMLLLMSILLIILYIWYIVVLYIHSKQHKKNLSEEDLEELKEAEKESISFFTIIWTLIIIYVAIEFAVKSALFVSNALSIPVLVTSLIILAALTSIPDAILSIKSAKRGDIDWALSNAVGSNIFDINIGLWLPLFIAIVFFDFNPIVDIKSSWMLFVFLLASLFATYVVVKKKEIKKIDTLYMWAVYLCFIAYVIYISMS